MILSGQTIRRRGIVDPFFERTVAHGMTFGLGPAGYDCRIAEDIDLAPGQFMLASTMERFVMPNDILATVHDKSTWARRGLAAQTTVFEPGWQGWPTLELSNHSNNRIVIVAGMPIVQVVFHLLDEPAELPYKGKYTMQGRGPQPAKFEE